ncbi:MAG: sulfite exporter TauE/SafE family protein [Clostridia bacterium]|nr:sulfite exporter TauE/SafE family protein [Clostridia bacterium]
MNHFISAIAGLLSGALGAMGLGGGGVLIIYLTLCENIAQTTAQGINLLFFIPSAVIASIYYIFKKMIDYKAVGLMSISGVLGAFLGFTVSVFVDAYILGKIFALLLLIVGIKQLFSCN